jgi:hypothetical protein
MIILKSIAIWLIFIMAESLNGTIRTLWLVPTLGTLQAHQISFIMGSFLVLAITTLFIRWLQASHLYELLSVGVLWMVLTLTFEIVLGRAILGYSWAQIAADYNLFQGGWMVIGLAWVALSPLMAAKIWGILPEHHSLT